MAKGGILGSGVKIGYRVGSPGTWVQIEQVKDITPPQFNRDRIDVTTHGEQSFRQYIPGLSDVSDATGTVLADLQRSTTPSHLGLKDLYLSQAIVWARIEIPTIANLATTKYLAYEYQARVSQWSPNPPIDADQTIDFAFQYADDLTIYEEVNSVF